MRQKMHWNTGPLLKRAIFLSVFFPLFTTTSPTSASNTNTAAITQAQCLLSLLASRTHKEYPLTDDAENNSQEPPVDELLTPITDYQEELPPNQILTPEPITIVVVNQDTTEIKPEKTACTNSKIRALVTGCCLGSIMGVLKYQTRRFFPSNWIVGFFIRILLVEAITTPCTAPNKDLMHESARAADWLVYGYIRLHTLHIL